VLCLIIFVLCFSLSNFQSFWLFSLVYLCDLPNLKLSYCEIWSLLPSEHVLSPFFGYPKAIVIWQWFAAIFSIKWLIPCTQLLTPIARPLLSRADNPPVIPPIREVTSLREVKDHRMGVCDHLIIWCPRCLVVAAYAVAIFHLEQGESRALIVWSRVESQSIPAIDRSTVE
jgi:hypothetical protein